uniref:Uncharacterized protein n=1 Tax=Borrelia duttonii TaxID=40834 RepID=Q8GRC9_9SPIR|nr:hypothetical protein [Borrelia duttonii]
MRNIQLIYFMKLYIQKKIILLGCNSTSKPFISFSFTSLLSLLSTFSLDFDVSLDPTISSTVFLSSSFSTTDSTTGNIASNTGSTTAFNTATGSTTAFNTATGSTTSASRNPSKAPLPLSRNKSQLIKLKSKLKIKNLFLNFIITPLLKNLYYLNLH